MPQVFRPGLTNAIAATAASQTRALPSGGVNAVFYNDGPGLAFIVTGPVGVVATLPALAAAAGAGGNATPVPVGAAVPFELTLDNTDWAAICLAGGTANVYCTSGVGQ